MRLIRFLPELPSKDQMLIEPTPVKQHVPEWYRIGESSFVEKGETHPGMKTCAPFLDIMLTGYVLLTPFDILVGRKENGDLDIRWNGPSEWNSFIGERPKELGQTIPRLPGHAPNGLTWSSKWGWKTPRGWSTIVCHPFNRQDLPFFTLSGLIDSDKFSANGNIPFFIKEDFIGVIPAGTPFAQIIPIKRKSWKQVMDYGLYHLGKKQGRDIRQTGQSYKQKLWIRKSYN